MKRFPALIFVIAAVLLAGCAGQQEYDTARRAYQLRQYDRAIESIRAALKSEPGNEKYIELLSRIRQDAARAEYQKGLQFFEKRQLDRALIAFSNAESYDPSFTEATSAYKVVLERKESVTSAIASVPALLADGKPDEALNRLEEVEAYAITFSEIGDLKAQALAASTIMHTKRGAVYLSEEKFSDARKEFFVALNRKPNYRPAAEGLAKAEAELSAAALVAEGKQLLEDERYEEAYAKFQQALDTVPGHSGALAAMIETSTRWAGSLYEEGKALAENGDFDSLAEALRRFERAGSLTERFADLEERTAAVRAALAGEFLRRAEMYERLGEDYLGLALINYTMSLRADPTQVAVQRKAADVKKSFDRRRAFYIDIRSVDDFSAATSFGKQVAQKLKSAALASGIEDLYVVAPFASVPGAEAVPSAGGMPGRRLTIFTSLLSENVVTRDKEKPQTVRSRYKLGTRFVRNPAFDKARKALAAAQSEETDVEQDYQDAVADAALAVTPEEKAEASERIAFERLRLFDAQDAVTEARRALADTPEDMEEEVFQPYDYKVFSVIMEATVEVSLEAADPDTGAVRNLEVITGSTAAEDTYNEGVLATDAEGAVADAEELPTESELLASARKAAADDAVAWLQKSLGQLNLPYYQRAKDLEEIGDVEGAAEYFYAFYLSAPDKSAPEAVEAINFVREHTHLITKEETAPVRPGMK